MLSALVAYSDSDEDEDKEKRDDGNVPPPSKRLKRGDPGAEVAVRADGSLPPPPPPPASRSRAPPTTEPPPPPPPAFHDLYSANARASTRDDPSLHGGRKRAIPHVQGNWPTHVYLEWHPTPAETTTLDALLAAVIRRHGRRADGQRDTPLPTDASPAIHTLLLSPLHAPLPLHISLSRPLALPTARKDGFHDALVARLRRAGVARPFAVRPASLKWVPNAERTRWFLVLGLHRPDRDELNRLLAACNDAARAAHLPELYRDGERGECAEQPRGCGRGALTPREPAEEHDWSDCFHISVAWTLERPAGEGDEDEGDGNGITLDKENDEAVRTAMEDVRRITVRFEAVKVKMGNVVTAVRFDALTSSSLSSSSKTERGILG